tara:strand:- start:1211 stop:1687 length:477 start_codon:yes stop_codon:yes gene_type:complete
MKTIKCVIEGGRDMPRAQNKRMQHRLYLRLVEKGPQSTQDLLSWYNHERPQMSKHTKGAQHGASVHELGGCLSSCILFEKMGTVPRAKVEAFIAQSQEPNNQGKFFETFSKRTAYEIAVWKARPMDEAVERAIASKRPIKKYPHFLQKEINKKIGDTQ